MAYDTIPETNLRQEAEFARYIEIGRADMQHRAAIAIADMSFAWKIIEQDVADERYQFVGDALLTSTPISRVSSLQTWRGTSGLEGISVTGRIIVDGQYYDAVTALGPEVYDMALDHREKTAAASFRCTVGAEKFAEPGYQPEAMFFATKVSELVNFLNMPLKKRVALERYNRRHPKPLY